MDNIVSYFYSVAEKHPHCFAIRSFNSTTQQWECITYENLAKSVRTIQQAFIQLHLPRQSRVVTWLDHCIQLAQIDLGLLAAGLVVVPFVKFHSADFVCDRILETDALVVFVENLSDALLIKGKLPKNWKGRIIVLANQKMPNDSSISTLNSLLHSTDVQQKITTSTSPRDLALILFTSGTTGTPKGVMLSHQNILSNSQNAFERTSPLPQHAKFLSCLPISSALERIAGYYAPLLHACRIIICHTSFRLLSNIQETSPHTIIITPFLLRKIQNELNVLVQQVCMEYQINRTELIQYGWLYFYSKNTNNQFQNNRDVLQNALMRAQKNIRKVFGKNFLYFVSGGAPLPQKIIHFFFAFNIPILQGYGLTEGCPCVTGNSFSDNDPHTVGKPMLNTLIRIGSDQEIQIFSSSIMKGYWKNPEATQQSFTSDGWLRTNDLGEITPEGNLRILGRKEKTIVLSNGFKVCPTLIEDNIIKHPYIEHAILIGNNRPFLIALVHFLPEKWEQWLLSHHIKPEDINIRFTRIQQYLLKEIRLLLKHYSLLQQPQKIIISYQKWNTENNYITIHGKINEQKILSDLATQIDSLYQNVKKI